MPKKPIATLAGRTIRCLLFDLGNTLWSRQDMAVWQQLKNAANLRAARILQTFTAATSLPDIAEDVLGQRLHTEVEERLRHMTRQEPHLEPPVGLATVQVLQQWGIEDVATSAAEAIFEALRVRIPASRPLFDDVLPTLRTLQQRGFLLGIVTNRHWGGELFQEDLQTLGLLEFFDPRHMAISIDLGIRKPNPAIFLHALHALNVAPEQAVMVGDSLVADIAGGKQIGLFTVWKVNQSIYLQAQLIAAGASAKDLQAPVQSGVTRAGQPDDLPEGMPITDDDYILAYMQSGAGKWDEHLHSTVKPDLIIEHVSDLLDVFSEVGVQ